MSGWLWTATRGLLGVVLTLIVVLALCLALLRGVPGGPFDQEKLAPPEVVAALEARYGLDRSYLVQLGDYLWAAAQGDLGPSFQQSDFTVSELIGSALPLSLWLGGAALGLALTLAVFSGLWCVRHGGALARIGGWLAALLQSTPKFVLGPLLVLWLALAWAWLPVSGYGQGASGWVLPVLTLSLPQWAWLHRVSSQHFTELQQGSHWRAARARGAGPSQLWTGLGLRLLWPRLASSALPVAIALLSGSAVVEQVFAIPGLGRLLLSGALNRDYTLVLGVVGCTALIVLLLGWFADLIAQALDARLRLHDS